jgi:hypothetical protein
MDTSAYVQLTFIGSGIRVIGAKNLSYGFHKIIIDGTTYTADAYASSLQFKQTIFEKTGLTYGQHTIKVLPNGTKLGSSTDTFIQIDAFEVI